MDSRAKARGLWSVVLVKARDQLLAFGRHDATSCNSDSMHARRIFPNSKSVTASEKHLNGRRLVAAEEKKKSAETGEF